MAISALGAVAGAGIGLAQTPSYSSTALLRVTSPGTIPTQDLNTAVEWYVALGTVPSVLGSTGAAQIPRMTADQVEAATVVEAGAGPGEVKVVGESGDGEAAQKLAAALSDEILRLLAKDPSVRLGSTTLTKFVAAGVPALSPTSPAKLAVAAFFFAFVAATTIVGLFGRRVNWLMDAQRTADLGTLRGLPTFPIASKPEDLSHGSIAAAAYLKSRLADSQDGSGQRLCVVNLGRPGSACAGTLSRGLELVGAVPEPHEEATTNTATVAEIRSGLPHALQDAAKLRLPIVLAVHRGARYLETGSMINNLQSLGLSVVCLVHVGSDGGRRARIAAARATVGTVGAGVSNS